MRSSTTAGRRTALPATVRKARRRELRCRLEERITWPKVTGGQIRATFRSIEPDLAALRREANTGGGVSDRCTLAALACAEVERSEVANDSMRICVGVSDRSK